MAKSKKGTKSPEEILAAQGRAERAALEAVAQPAPKKKGAKKGAK